MSNWKLFSSMTNEFVLMNYSRHLSSADWPPIGLLIATTMGVVGFILLVSVQRCKTSSFPITPLIIVNYRLSFCSPPDLI